jgi:antitoxin (DNA-binding transcriptional repressor) of toxin-antitoxin stability system
MKTATIRQVRNDFGTVLGWVNAGEEVTILKRRQPVARLLPPAPATGGKVQLPDFAGRMKRIFGNRRTHGVAALLKEREERPW